MKVILQVVKGPHEGQTFEFSDHQNFIVGRASTAQFRLPEKDQFFSRHHFLVEVNPPLCRLLDLNSRNGTYVNKQRVTTAELQHGDLIRAGKTVLRVALEKDAPPPTAAAPPVRVGEATLVPRDWPQRTTAAPTTTPDRPAITAASPRDAPVAAVEPPRAAAQPIHPPPERPATYDGPQVFPGYQIRREIGRGGMGIVYEARSNADGAIVAIKSVVPAVAASRDDLQRFVREAEVLRDLQHPHIVPFRAMAEAEDRVYFVMNYIPSLNGEQLARQSGGRLPVELAVEATCQMLSALSYAHKRGYVHRDVKPSNLLIESGRTEPHAWLADFGLARAYQSSRLSGLTMTGDIGGTTPYMAPEQITNFRDVSPAADQYSAAATLYHLLTGRRVYDFPNDVAQQLLMILQHPIIPITARRADLPPPLVHSIQRALSREPKARFPDAHSFEKSLRDSV